MEENEKNYLDWEGLLEYHRNLETKLSEKANTEDLADVATSGDYNDLDNTPTNVSLFTNDAGYMTSEIDNTNGHDYVEIGGIKWATMNVGASKITDIGLYFQWGDILGYTSEEVGVDKNFTWEDYKFNPSGDGTTFSKYNSTDLKTSLDTEDDAAANAWGSDWRVPSTSELQTLSQAVNISWIDNYQESGVPGLILTDKEDSSKVLFLPATGVCNDGSIIDDDTTGFYWSKSLGNTDDKGLGLGFDKTNGTTWEYSNSRSLGFAIRPVLEGPAKRTIMGVTQLEKDKWNSKVSGIKIGESGEVISPVNGVVIIPNQSNVQADWNQNDSSADDFIKNKPGIGVANGLATLDSTGKVPSSQLPSYVDDVIEGYYHGEEDPQSGETVYNMYEDDEYTILITPESGKIYLDIPSSNSYRWSGSQYVLIGAPYDLPIASANTLGGVKVGNNLSIDQNGVLSAADAANEVQIGGETPSSDSDVEIFIDTTEDATVEVYSKQLQDGKFVVIKDLNAAPTESTLTYTENGTVKNFKQGDEVRVPDAEADNGYTFYKLYALTTESDVTAATWDKVGAGGGDVPEILTIHLAEPTGGNTLIGKSIIILDSENNILLNTKWDDTFPMLLEINPGITYTITVEGLSLYYIISGNNNQTYTSESGKHRNYNLLCVLYGVYIEDINNKLYKAGAWLSSYTANCVVMIDENPKRLGPRVNKPAHSNTTDPIKNYITPKAISSPAYPWVGDNPTYDNGKDNTAKLLLFNKDYGTNTNEYAAPYVTSYTFPNGATGCYLCDMMDMYKIANYLTDINTCLSKIGLTLIASEYTIFFHIVDNSGNVARLRFPDCYTLSGIALTQNQILCLADYYLP